MSPDGQSRGGKIVASNNLYTAIVALAFCVVLAAAAFVAYKCYCQYGTIFGVPKRPLSRSEAFNTVANCPCLLPAGVGESVFII